MFKFIKWLGDKYVEGYMRLYGNISDADLRAMEISGCNTFGIGM